MLSTCPECGRSYPSHHGSICKMCVAKKAKGGGASTSSPTSKPPVSSSAKPGSPVSRPAASSASSVRTPSASSVNKPVSSPAPTPSGSGNFSSPIPGMMIESSPSSSQEKSENECPHCGYVNEEGSVFCFSCKQMLQQSKKKAKTDYPLTEIKGGVPAHVGNLKKAGITTTSQLIEKGTNPIKRRTITAKSGVSETFLLRLVNQADLLRVPSIEPENAYMLEVLGITSVKALERKKASDIMSSITRQKAILNSKGILVLPKEDKVEKWVEEAKALDKVVS